MQLAKIFQDGMTLQRKKPVKIWGESNAAKTIEVKVDEQIVCTSEIAKGRFEFYLPAQDTLENATLQIGSQIFKNVDFGEVWIAGGQSNMEFLLKFDAEGETEIVDADDEHLRMYDVAKYAFEKEREEKYKDETYWERWMTFNPHDAPEFSAVGLYFAKELRTMGVPVAIVGCTWGGTTASTWLDKQYLLADEELKSYVTEFEEIVAKLDLEKYYRVNKFVRHGMESVESKKMMEHMLRNTITLEERMQMQQASENTADKSSTESLGMPEGITIEEIMAVGPNDKNRPGALYETMLSEISGYTTRGVIWYQGEADEKKAGMYAKLFTSLITCWRKDWAAELPFLFVQLAPLRTWMGNTSENFPLLRKQQELVSETVDDVYMITSSDVGNEFDIHPKVKKPLGHRLALCAKAEVYGENVSWQSPKATAIQRDCDTLKITFMHGDGLHIKGETLHAVSVWVDEEEVKEYAWQIDDDCLVIQAGELAAALVIRVEIAETGFYEMNLYNEAGVPARPGTLEMN